MHQTMSYYNQGGAFAIKSGRDWNQSVLKTSLSTKLYTVGSGCRGCNKTRYAQLKASMLCGSCMNIEFPEPCKFVATINIEMIFPEARSHFGLNMVFGLQHRSCGTHEFQLQSDHAWIWAGFRLQQRS